MNTAIVRVCVCAPMSVCVHACMGVRVRMGAHRVRKAWFTISSAKNEAHIHCKTSPSFNLMSHLKKVPGSMAQFAREYFILLYLGT